MLLRTLLEARDLKLSVLVGAEDVDRPIRWVFTTDLRDPRRYLSGGELVLTGLMWRRAPEDSSAFVSAVAEAGVAALVAGTAELGHVPDDLVDACRRHGLPLLELAVDVSFATVTERVILALAAERAEPTAALERHRQLVTAVAEGGGLTELLRLAAGELGADCRVLAPTSRPVAGTGPDLLPGQRAELARRFLLADRLPRTVRLPGHGPVALFAAGARGGSRLTSWVLAVDGDLERWSTQHRELAVELAGLVGLERSRAEDRRHIENRSAAALTRLVLAEAGGQAEITARLAAAGFDQELPLRLLSAEITGAPAATVAAVLDELVADLVPHALVAPADEEAIAVVAAAPDRLGALVGQVREGARVLQAGLGGAGRLVVGVSGPVAVTGVRAAAVEARSARRLALHRDARGGVLSGEEIASHQLLLATVPDELRRSFRARLLGPLRDYDAEHGSDLVHTLRVFLDCACSWTRTAAQLHLHVNTLRYRIGRIEELTGRRMTSFADRVDLFLALELG
ncbi:DNA-binding transcriptional regulator, PucR family [Streptoalloteichus tenebrarius]|uniref:DNA-binding transcriptional regulator, PucR family n=1 Tax=Streptoalloteichus tenebrarius (strain ATCC 17920 / DSM 40477 / JCM 4838 / CBS 697.72 / NBRC 16177 / NCIMB 11028 / NRRL B-12390 / A12253. 1 / ISP 5477) TaxID=1933 RepID=A0ABT1I212_STRSD|nr:PucR family transcriptional regulator [Streptoalloteichus tenebrarius]MCP2261773.1 DNA-binding transcriptional regulator, PucR family [Streptoalloteichus tenebrarius]BFF00830.1 PucR family transcriptional regulator ligand-binding domain-containing protein [Streptoalloteichus tenebrarius]